MFYCPKCSNSFDIAKSTTDLQTGGEKDNYDTLIDFILTNKTVTKEQLDKLNVQKLLKSIEYKKLNNKKREKIYNIIQDNLPENKKKLMLEKDTNLNENNIAYFICSNCSFYRKINNGTLLYSKSSLVEDKVKNMSNRIHSNILPLTRKYICPNKVCESHKNIHKKEAVIFRYPNSYKIKHICKTCKTEW